MSSSSQHFASPEASSSSQQLPSNISSPSILDTRAPRSGPLREGKPLPSAKGRFNIEIRSVHYFGERDSLCAAVVIRTSFDLKNDKQLKYAKCPLLVHPYAEGIENGEPLAIRQYYPEQQEFVQVKFHTGSKEWSFEPTIEFLEAGAHIGGIKGARSDDKPTVISLMTQHDQEAIPRISWQYDDKEKSRYPGTVDVLLVIEKPRPHGTRAWFEFKLQLTDELKVDVHGDRPSIMTSLTNRFVGIPKAGEHGWHFKIRGEWNPKYAEQALESVLEGHDEVLVGLKAAAKSLLDALKPPKSSKKDKGKSPITS